VSCFQRCRVRGIEHRRTIGASRVSSLREAQDEEEAYQPPWFLVLKKERYTLPCQIQTGAGGNQGLGNL
jgi:hypothetical protein